MAFLTQGIDGQKLVGWLRRQDDHLSLSVNTIEQTVHPNGRPVEPTGGFLAPEQLVGVNTQAADLSLIMECVEETILRQWGRNVRGGSARVGIDESRRCAAVAGRDSNRDELVARRSLPAGADQKIVGEDGRADNTGWEHREQFP